MDEQAIESHRERALNPEKPVLRGTAQNPDAFFQAREACNKYYDACPEIVAGVMEKFAERTGRSYKPFDFFGHPEAERVIILMGSGAECVRETVDYLNKKNEKVGVLVVRLYRPFSVKHFLSELPKTVKAIAVCDRTKEPAPSGTPVHGCFGGPGSSRRRRLKALGEETRVIGGRYGLSSKEFTPAMIKAICDELRKESPKNHFTVGIMDDVTHHSLNTDVDFDMSSLMWSGPFSLV